MVALARKRPLQTLPLVRSPRRLDDDLQRRHAHHRGEDDDTEWLKARLALGVAVPVDRKGEGTLVVELLREKTGGAAAVAKEAATLHAAEVAQGALASAYAALQSAPLGARGRPKPQVRALVPHYDAARAQYASKSYAQAAQTARKVVQALVNKRLTSQS